MTPCPLGSGALLRHVAPEIADASAIWEPAAGGGWMARPLAETGRPVFASDVHDYGGLDAVHDFLMPFLPPGLAAAPDWVVTNPPFRLAEQFAHRALAVTDGAAGRSRGVALLLRTAWAEGIGRYQTLFQPRPPSAVAIFTERLPIVKGQPRADASSATSYAWFVWSGGRQGPTRTVWIPPCRKDLEQPGDYPAAVADLATAADLGGLAL